MTFFKGKKGGGIGFLGNFAKGKIHFDHKFAFTMTPVTETLYSLTDMYNYRRKECKKSHWVFEFLENKSNF